MAPPKEHEAADGKIASVEGKCGEDGGAVHTGNENASKPSNDKPKPAHVGEIDSHNVLPHLQVFRYMDLPRDIHLIVYETCSIQRRHCGIKKEQNPLQDNTKVALVVAFPPAVNLLQTCSVVHEEASAIFQRQQFCQLAAEPTKLIITGRRDLGIYVIDALELISGNRHDTSNLKPHQLANVSRSQRDAHQTPELHSVMGPYSKCSKVVVCVDMEHMQPVGPAKKILC